jgi:hypothetical protein
LTTTEKALAQYLVTYTTPAIYAEDAPVEITIVAEWEHPITPEILSFIQETMGKEVGRKVTIRSFSRFEKLSLIHRIINRMLGIK